MSKDKPTPGGRAKKNTAAYLTFMAAVGDSEASVEMRYEDENIWSTQKMMAALYDVSAPAINQRLKRIFSDNELEESSVVKQYLTTAADGKSYDTQRYNLAAILAVGYKVNSERAVCDVVDAGKIKLTSLPGHVSGHFVPISQRIVGTERRPAVVAGDSSRHFSRRSVARDNQWLCRIPTIIPTNCRDSAIASESRQTSRHFGGTDVTAANVQVSCHLSCQIGRNTWKHIA